MRLFVAAWPTEELTAVLCDARNGLSAPDLRWVPAPNWHATLAFLGSVPDEEHDEVLITLASIGTTMPPCIAEVGPTTSVLGKSVLCVPVGGLDALAVVVREATMALNRSPDRGEPFLGHLTMARARRGRQIPRAVLGVPLSSPWPVDEFRLVSSTAGREGARYSAIAHVKLDG